MSSLRRAAARATDVACRATGRARVVRASRFVYRRACLDVPNDPRTNGELELQRWVLGVPPPGQPLRIVDVGANVGHWSAAMLAAARQAGRLDNLDLHAFEPSAYTFALLEETLKDQPARLRRCAVGDHTGSATLYVTGAGAGTNSLHKPGNLGVHATEEVPVITLAAYANDAGLNDITLVKIDTEGHDLSVLRGARKLFAEQRIAVVQFEYNYRWIFARSFLLDAFGLLSQFGYHLGKLTPVGVEFYPNWDPDLETFIEGNYVACSAPTAPLLPSITWWKAAGGP